MNAAQAWREAYDTGMFAITTDKPSTVAEYVHRAIADRDLPQHVLDLGCGNGRNTVFFADHGFHVDAVDLVKLETFQVPASLASHIRFYEEDVAAFTPPEDGYAAVLLTRLIQYLPENVVKSLLQKTARKTVDGSAIGLSYTARGGILTRETELPTYQHDISDVKTWLREAGLSLTVCERGAATTKHVPYKERVKTFDICCVKP